MELRQLAEPDRVALEHLLASAPEHTMFLRSNLRSAGFDYTGRVYQGDYFGACDARGLQGVAAHYWNGNVLLYAPDEHALTCIALGLARVLRRPLAGVIGPLQQADR